MKIVLSALGSNTITAISITCLVAVAIIVYVVLSVLAKRGKLNGKTAAVIQNYNNRLSSFGTVAKSKLTDGSKISILYWSVLALQTLSAILLLTMEIIEGYYSLSFLKSLLYIGFILFMIVFNVTYSPIAPYYYEFKPMLFSYSAVTLFFAIIEFCVNIANGAIVFPLLTFAGELLFYGVIFATRFCKKEFKPRDLLVYLGAAFLVTVPTVNYFWALGVGSLTMALPIVTSTVGWLAGVLVVVLLIYFYDGFSFLKKLFGKKETR